MAHESSCEKYVIRIYDVGCNEPPYVPYGDDIINPIVTEFADDKKELLKKWRKLLKNYEGYGYTIYQSDHCIVGGAFDPSDDDIINENIA